MKSNKIMILLLLVISVRLFIFAIPGLTPTQDCSSDIVNVNTPVCSMATQQVGFSSVLAGQQAVTASAANLGSNALHGVCIKSLPANSLEVYVGPSGETTSTGYDLSPGEKICFAITNTNLIYVIASSTGASITWTGN